MHVHRCIRTGIVVLHLLFSCVIHRYEMWSYLCMTKEKRSVHFNGILAPWSCCSIHISCFVVLFASSLCTFYGYCCFIVLHFLFSCIIHRYEMWSYLCMTQEKRSVHVNGILASFWGTEWIILFASSLCTCLQLNISSWYATQKLQRYFPSLYLSNVCFVHMQWWQKYVIFLHAPPSPVTFHRHDISWHEITLSGFNAGLLWSRYGSP